METYGLIGKTLEHSFSKSYFEAKFEKLGINAQYLNFELESIEQFPELLENSKMVLKGLNVTIPYKSAIIPYLDSLDPLAEKIRAVNTIRLKNNQLTGYNTDYFGFRKSLLELLGKEWVSSALVLGSGGASKAVCQVLNDLDIHSIIVSRSGKVSYNTLGKQDLEENRLIVNCTPLGTFPETDTKPPIPYKHLTRGHFLFDLVYNPPITEFMKEGMLKGAKTINGEDMLNYQAEKAWEIWNK